MRTLLILLSFLILSCTSSTHAGATVSEDLNYDKEHFRGWLVDFSKEAEQQGISKQTIYLFMKNAEFIPTVVKLDRKQPDVKATFPQYLKNTIPDYKIRKAREKYQENQALLEKVGKAYGVQPRFIVALWAIESDFGQNMGNFSVPNALATLAYEGRRAKFFRDELLNALRIVDQDHIAFDQMKGSWAGAMGQTQFMPSSFLKLAEDYNKDGKRDIWGTREDVFASIAHYLSSYGWDDDTSWGREVKLPSNFDTALIGKTIEKPISQWQKLGVKTKEGHALPQRHGLQASIVRPESNGERVFLVYSNYKTVLQWNRSLYFATAVGLLSDRIE